jgi:hypothetical protein
MLSEMKAVMGVRGVKIQLLCFYIKYGQIRRDAIAGKVLQA